MALKKSVLYASLWAYCNTLRDGMDSSQCKDYVLFIKCASDNYVNARQAVMMIGASKGFIKDGNKNKLRELDGVSQTQTQTQTRHICKLVERYANLMPALEVEVDKLSAMVGEHLKKMRVVWN